MTCHPVLVADGDGRWRLHLPDGSTLRHDAKRWRGGPARHWLEALSRARPGSVPPELLPHRGKLPGDSSPPSPSPLSPSERTHDGDRLRRGMNYGDLAERLTEASHGSLAGTLGATYPGLAVGGGLPRRHLADRKPRTVLTYGDLAELGAGMTTTRAAGVLGVHRATVHRDRRDQ